MVFFPFIFFPIKKWELSLLREVDCVDFNAYMKETAVELQSLPTKTLLSSFNAVFTRIRI